MSNSAAFLSSAGSSDSASSECSPAFSGRGNVLPDSRGTSLRLLHAAASPAPVADRRGTPAGEAPLRDAFHFYDPPYERAVDDVLIRQFGKYLAPLRSLGHGVSGRPSAAGTPRADVLIELDDRRIGFVYASRFDEQGSEEHAAAVHDALLVGDGVADAVYRIREADLVHRLPDVLSVVARWEPALLSERGRVNLDRLASPEAREACVSPRAVEVRLRYGGPTHACSLVLDTGTEPSDTLLVRRFDRRRPGPWSALYAGAQRPVDPPMMSGAAPRLARSA